MKRLIGVVLLISAGHSMAADAPRGRAPGAVSPGVYSESGGVLGSTDGMIRIWGEDRAALLVNLRYATRGGGDQIGSLGLVHRRISRGGAFNTLYFRTDARRTPNDNTHLTLMLGAENRGPRSTGRFRGYHSPHGADLIDERVEEELVPLPDGSARQLRRFYERYEVPLSGIDIEWGPRIPLPAVLGDLRLLGGGYWRDGSMVPAEKGWMGRLEYRPRPMILLEVAAYTNVEFEKFEFFGGAQLVIPFGRSDSGDAVFWFEPLPYYPRPTLVRTSFKENQARRTESHHAAPASPPAPPAPPAGDGETPLEEPFAEPPLEEDEDEGGEGDDDDEEDMDVGG